MSRLFLPLILLGCEADSVSDGTAVGNPGKMTASLSEGDDVSYTSARLSASRIYMSDCSDGETDVATDIAFDPRGATLLLPPGEWCGMGIETDAPFTVAGQSSEGGTFTLSLDLDALAFISWTSFTIENTDTVLRLGDEGWLVGDDLDIETGEHVDIDVDDERYDDVWWSLVDGTGLFADSSGDGRVDADDALLAAHEDSDLVDDLEEEDEPEPDEDEMGGGCSNDENYAGLWFLLALGGLGRLRRTRQAPPMR